jgi:hypothetical protein
MQLNEEFLVSDEVSKATQRAVSEIKRIPQMSSSIAVSGLLNYKHIKAFTKKTKVDGVTDRIDLEMNQMKEITKKLESALKGFKVSVSVHYHLFHLQLDARRTMKASAFNISIHGAKSFSIRDNLRPGSVMNYGQRKLAESSIFLSDI